MAGGPGPPPRERQGRRVPYYLCGLREGAEKTKKREACKLPVGGVFVSARVKE